MSRQIQDKPRRRVWRITEAAPMGEFVDPDAHVSGPVPLQGDETKAPRGGWLESSLDLLNGTDVTVSEESMPDDLFDEMWGTAPKKD